MLCNRSRWTRDLPHRLHAQAAAELIGRKVDIFTTAAARRSSRATLPASADDGDDEASSSSDEEFLPATPVAATARDYPLEESDGNPVDAQQRCNLAQALSEDELGDYSDNFVGRDNRPFGDEDE